MNAEPCGFVKDPGKIIEQVKALCEEAAKPHGFVVRNSVPDELDDLGEEGITIVAPKGLAVIYWDQRDEQHGFWMAAITDDEGEDGGEMGHASDVVRVIAQAVESLVESLNDG